MPVVVGDDWKAVFLWKALYEAGVFVNMALHPAVPPAGALLRTSVMATHDHATLDDALEIFDRVKREVRDRARPAPDRLTAPLPSGRAGVWAASDLSTPAQEVAVTKSALYAHASMM